MQVLEQVMVYLPFAAGLLVIGAISGVIAGLFGVGGGIITVPAMAFTLQALGYDADIVMHVAVGTSLATIIGVGSASARAHNSHGAVDWALLRLWAPALIISALLGGIMAGLYSGDVLRIIFGVMAMFIAVNMILPVQRRMMERLKASPTTNRISAFLIGYVSSLMGIGGGSLSVPTMVAFGYPAHTAVGTGSALGVVLAVPGAIGFMISGWGEMGLPPLSLGYVNLAAMLLIGGVASLTAPIGAGLAHRLDQKQLKRAFAAFLIIVGLRMIYQAVMG
jgi:uncharacterized protein